MSNQKTPRKGPGRSSQRPSSQGRSSHGPSPKKPFYRQTAPRKPLSTPESGLVPETPLHLAPFSIREDWEIQPSTGPQPPADANGARAEALPKLVFKADNPFVRLYQGNCLTLLDAIAVAHPEGWFDCIFADPPYFLSNGGITCHAGRMVKVDKGDWDKSQGPEENHNFNREWLLRCQRVLKPNGTLWVTGTHHVIFSIGYAMQQLGFKILNDIAWEKPNPPPNLSCRYFTHSTETVLWAAKTEKSKHLFNYKAMKAVTGKQMKTVWTMSSPSNGEKTFGKHPTQKPVALVERCLLASTNPGDLVLDPFMGGGTTAVACLRLGRWFVGVEMDEGYLIIATSRANAEIVAMWLRCYRVRIEVGIFSQNDLDLFSNLIDRSASMDDKPEVQTERMFHETKFVFLSCAEVERGSVVHTTVDVSLQEAWAKTPTGKKRETTHVVRCETEIFKVKPL